MKNRNVRIADFAKVIAGGTPMRGVKSYYEGTIPWVKTLDLNLCTVVDTEEKITEEGLKSIRGEINPPGTVMVAMYGGAGTIGKSGLLGVPAATNQAVASILPNERVFNSAFLHFQLMYLRKNWMQFSQGNRKDPNINKSVVEDMLIWLPSELSVQESIGRALKAQLAAVEEARQAVQYQIDELTHLANAVIRESLSHPETEMVSLGDMLDEVKQGIGKVWANYPVLGATRSGLAPAKEPVGKFPERYKPVFHGTVFYNPMRILIGSIAMVDDNDEPGITSPDYVAIRGREGLVDSRWFYYWLRSPAGEHCITSLARGAVRERMLFNRLAEGEAAFPPFAIQQKASQILAEIRPMKTHVEAQLREIELLPARLLATAFGDG